MILNGRTTDCAGTSVINSIILFNIDMCYSSKYIKTA